MSNNLVTAQSSTVQFLAKKVAQKYNKITIYESLI